MRQHRTLSNIWAFVLLAAICIFPGSGWAEPHDAQSIRRMVEDAQKTFERGVQLYGQGSYQEARMMFDKCHQVLLSADQMADERFQRRVDGVFHLFYEQMAEIDPNIARQMASIRSQVHKTYEAAPVYAGHVRYYMNYLLKNKRSFLENSFNRAFQYMPMIKREFHAAGIPKDLAYMALIESGFRPDPVSHAGAKGLWQFMPATARQYGLRVGDGIDERTDPVKSTRAAARYLSVLYRTFGDWPLAVAAYNCGQGRVARALATNNASTYWELSEKNALPLETQRYVPSIIAVTLIARSRDAYGFGT